jgi:type IV secretion system protein VirB5
MVRREIGLLLAVLCAAPVARAQFAVIDVASLTQLISQVNTLEQQVATARSQLSQAQTEFQSITGTRGMQQLLSGTTRNYLPGSWATLRAAPSGGGYPLLTSAVRTALQADTVLSAGQLAALSPGASAQLQAGRQSAALQQGVSHAALANTSSRFAALQQLIDAIGSAGDQKAILDLQARIAAEAGMLQNEHIKLQVLYQGTQAEEWANAQTLRERAVAGHGQFDSRFQPHP